MARVCDICSKGVMFGGHRKHRRGSSGGGGAWSFRAQRTLHKWSPNLRTIKVEINGTPEKARICMKCYKRIRLESK